VQIKGKSFGNVLSGHAFFSTGRELDYLLYRRLWGFRALVYRPRRREPDFWPIRTGTKSSKKNSSLGCQMDSLRLKGRRLSRYLQNPLGDFVKPVKDGLEVVDIAHRYAPPGETFGMISRDSHLCQEGFQI
jgi:hypothetical protein